MAVSRNFAHRKHPNPYQYSLSTIFALYFTFHRVEGTTWYLFVEADIHDRRIWAKAPTNGSVTCIKGILCNNIKLTVDPKTYKGDVEGIKTHDTLLEVSGDWKICWLTWFWRSKQDFATSTPVSTLSNEEKMDVTQLIVVCYTYVEFEGIARHVFGPSEKNLAKRSRKMVKNCESGLETKWAQVWTPQKPTISSLTAPSLTLCVKRLSEGILRAVSGTWVKKWTVIRMPKRSILEVSAASFFFAVWFRESDDKETSKKISITFHISQKACPKVTDKIWPQIVENRCGPSGRESQLHLHRRSTMPRFTIHKAICALSAQVRWNENLQYRLKIKPPFGIVIRFTQI